MSSSCAGHVPTASAPVPSGSDRKDRKPASRQLLSCTKCRERKVKCDRTKPCTACCARGHPKECEFVVGEGNDYSPIPQSYEIRKLRLENQRLREKLQAARLPQSEDEEDDSGDHKQRGNARTTVGRQRRFKGQDRTDNLYFGTPGLATIIHEFASFSISRGTQSLTHPIPRGRDMYAPESTIYPFSVIVEYSGPDQLWTLLPDRQELFACLDLFYSKAQSCSFPHMPDEVTKTEVERFLNNPENAHNYPDMLALIFATIATGLQMGQYDRNGGQWKKEAVETNRVKCDVFISASMQALRNASFMSRPTILGLQTLIMMGPYLTNTGRFLDAWTLFGTTIRIAHSIGLHRHPTLLDPSPSLRESRVRQTLWWWMLHMDQQYSITLGRPLGISGIGDCPQPEISTTDTTMLRLHRFMDEFTVLSRQILCSTDMTNQHRIDECTDKLFMLWDTMPEALQFNESWLQGTTQLPDAPLDALSASLFAKVHSLLILINRQRTERDSADMSPEDHGISYGMSGVPTRRAPVRGRALVVQSASSVLRAFLFFYHRNPALLVCWTMGQQAFNAAMILLLDAWEADYDIDLMFVEQTYGVFVELEKNGVHKLADLACGRIFAGLAQVKNRNVERAEGNRRASEYAQQYASLAPDTAPLVDLSDDTMMGGTGHYLLEDPGYQFYVPQYPTFRPWAWQPTAADNSAHPSNPSGPPTPQMLPQAVPVSQIPAAPFPVMSTAPITPYSIGLQPRMGPTRRSTAPAVDYNWPTNEDSMLRPGFTAINENTREMHPAQMQQHQQQHHYQYQIHQQSVHQAYQQQSFLASPPHAPPVQVAGRSAKTSQSLQTPVQGSRPRSHHRSPRPAASQKSYQQRSK